MNITSYYNFILTDKNAGYFEIRHTKDEIHLYTLFKIKEKAYENKIVLNKDDDKVMKYKYGDNDWRLIPKGGNYYPTAAYPILLKNLHAQRKYIAINEEDGMVLGETVLARNGNTVDEIRDGKITRKFWIKGENIFRIDWGGAISELCKNIEDAKKNSGL